MIHPRYPVARRSGVLCHVPDRRHDRPTADLEHHDLRALARKRGLALGSVVTSLWSPKIMISYTAATHRLHLIRTCKLIKKQP